MASLLCGPLLCVAMKQETKGLTREVGFDVLIDLFRDSAGEAELAGKRHVRIIVPCAVIPQRKIFRMALAEPFHQLKGCQSMAEIDPFFRKARGYVVSAYEKCVKPEERIYRILLERFSLKAEECVFIDDLPVNLKGAGAVGINGILFTGPEEAKNALIDMGV